jgi:hypothetical protein
MSHEKWDLFILLNKLFISMKPTEKEIMFRPKLATSSAKTLPKPA